MQNACNTSMQILFVLTMPLRKLSDQEKTVVAASRIFRDVCSRKPPYRTTKEFWEGLKLEIRARDSCLLFFLRQRKNEPTRCSVQNAIPSEGKR